MKRFSIVSVIDDDDLFQFIIRKLLIASETVQTVLPFHNGKEAFDYLIENQERPDLLPDIVFLDIKMPVMDGWEFLEQFCSMTFPGKEKISIYICTSSINSTDEEIARKYSVLSGYYIKPISKDDVEEVLERELKLKNNPDS